MKKNNWKKALKLIPSGNSLISKNPNFILPDLWPTYFSRAAGFNVWDLHNQKYTDMFFGVGTNILGYQNKLVDKKIIDCINKSNMSSLNCYEEVELAEKLTSIHPHMNMARFARTGAEANSIAIRIARAATGKDNIAVCGYHGWSDWYLAANLKSKSNLNNHLLKGLSIDGIPNQLKNTVYSFEYNNYEGLKKIISNTKLAAVIMEVSRTFVPNSNFLKKIRKECTKNNIILIFDECTSGFRQSFGGLHKLYKVYPDIAMFGKALGNGYAITSVIGRREVMENAKKTFISSTFWTERIGFVAGLATLKIMEKNQSWKIITNIGKKIKKGWVKYSLQTNVKIKLTGLDALPAFSFTNDKNNILITYFCQEMLKKGFIVSNVVFVSIVHNDKVLSKYFECCYDIFKIIGAHSIDEIRKKLSGRPRNSSFSRLN
jgi:glutamate-1-semialdehyde 2,1-aminomutase